jgi:leucyl/phenylalanyl-tRNA--protein transferase
VSGGRAHRVTWIDASDAPECFPPAQQALREPNGLLAAGGDLSPARLLAAYRRGIFPWYSPGQQILWWSPDPREVLWPQKFHLSRSLARALRQARSQGDFAVLEDCNFEAVIDACAAPRSSDTGTWITPEMRRAYCGLHAAGCAHSIEVWRGARLVGGLYGVQLGGVFFGESMFSAETNGSKFALEYLCRERRGGSIALLDCQFPTPHLRSLGSEALPRRAFLAQLQNLAGPAAGHHAPDPVPSGGAGL